MNRGAFVFAHKNIMQFVHNLSEPMKCKKTFDNEWRTVHNINILFRG